MADHKLGLEYEVWSSDKIEKQLSFDMSSHGPPKRSDDVLFGELGNKGKLKGGIYFPQVRN